MAIVSANVWAWMGQSSDRAGQVDADVIMDRVVTAVEELWLRDWSSVVGVPAVFTYTDGLVTVANHHLATDTPVQFALLDGGHPLVAGTTYFVRDVTADTFALAVTAAGAALPLTSDGTGYVWADPRPSYIDQALIMQAAALYNRKKILNGVVAGSPEMGPFRVGRFDPDIQRLLDPGGWAVA